MYQQHITKALEATEHAGMDPRWVEAAMRNAEETGCLDHLTPSVFTRYAREAAGMCAYAIETGDKDLPEALAQSYGL